MVGQSRHAQPHHRGRTTAGDADTAVDGLDQRTVPSPDNPLPDRPPPADQGLKSPIARRDAGQGLVVGSDANVHFSFDGDRITRGDPSAYDVSELSANPYPGLASYTYATRAFYGGRTALVRESAQRLTSPGNEPCLVFVIGTRGSGKSSFVQAGLLPALTAVHQSLGREVRWSVRQPGGKPIAALGQALTDVGSLETPAGGWPARLRTTWALNRVLAEQTPAQQVNILVLDQFEEVFTLAGVEERLAICDMLANLGTFARLRTQVIV